MSRLWRKLRVFASQQRGEGAERKCRNVLTDDPFHGRFPTIERTVSLRSGGTRERGFAGAHHPMLSASPAPLMTPTSFSISTSPSRNLDRMMAAR